MSARPRDLRALALMYPPDSTHIIEVLNDAADKLEGYEADELSYEDVAAALYSAQPSLFDGTPAEDLALVMASSLVAAGYRVIRTKKENTPT